MSTTKAIIVLPCEGSPYLWKNTIYNTKGKVQKEQFFTEIQKVVRGRMEEINPTMLRIHPMFENRWRIADALRIRKGVEVYVNENGDNDCGANMACLRLERDIPDGMITAKQYMSAPLKVARAPYFGEIALVVPYKELTAVIGNTYALSLVCISDYYERMGFKREPLAYDEKGYEQCLDGYVFEPEDEAEAKMFKSYATLQQWGIDSFGRTYINKTGRPDEKQNTDYDSDSENDDPFESSDEEEDEVVTPHKPHKKGDYSKYYCDVEEHEDVSLCYDGDGGFYCEECDKETEKVAQTQTAVAKYTNSQMANAMYKKNYKKTVSPVSEEKKDE